MAEFDNPPKDDIGENRDTVETADGVETNWNEVVNSFDDMDLKEDLLRGKLWRCMLRSETCCRDWLCQVFTLMVLRNLRQSSNAL